MKIETKVEVYYDTEEDLARGECEVVSKTRKNPEGTWKKSKIAVLTIEVEDNEC